MFFEFVGHCCIWLCWCCAKSEKDHDEKIRQQREKQLELIDQLKCQLEDLETYAYEVRMHHIMCTISVIVQKHIAVTQFFCGPCAFWIQMWYGDKGGQQDGRKPYLATRHLFG